MTLTVLLGATLVVLLYIAQVLRKILWLLALVTRNQMVMAKKAKRRANVATSLRFLWSTVSVAVQTARSD